MHSVRRRPRRKLVAFTFIFKPSLDLSAQRYCTSSPAWGARAGQVANPACRHGGPPNCRRGVRIAVTGLRGHNDGEVAMPTRRMNNDAMINEFSAAWSELE